MQINPNFSRLKESYLFSQVRERTAAYQKAHPEARLITLSIGDVTLPLGASVVAAMHGAADEMAKRETFKGYGPDRYCYGYESLLNALQARYARLGVSLKKEEIFVSDGAKSDCGNLSDLFSAENIALIPDPVYPAYYDANVMAGRKIVFARASAENGFLPMPQEGMRADLVYLCSPNNPTGAAYSKAQLQEWVDYANRTGAVILYDAAYEAFVRDKELARSVYQTEGAKECAIEICSFSKTAGFTGVRCGYTVVPEALVRGGARLNRLWKRRQNTKFTGVSYITQTGAAAAFSEEGERDIAERLTYYRENADMISDCLRRLGIPFTGGKNSPYLWVRCPEGESSWDFFERMLSKANVVVMPGSGFGESGEGYFRITAFGRHGDTREACERMEKLLKKG